MSLSPTLMIDAGNQRLKWRAEGSDYVVDWKAGAELHDPGWPHAEANGLALVSSVRSIEENHRLTYLLEQLGYQVVFPRVEAERKGLICGYRDSSQLGVDRWLSMLACWEKLQRGFIFVGAGTALTVDLVYATGKHGGGYIAAGLGLAREALLSRSEKLRNQYVASVPELSPGQDTASAINNGALLFATEMVRGVQRAAGMNQAKLILSGGDAELLAQQFEGAVLWPNIVLDGLAAWLDRDDVSA